MEISPFELFRIKLAASAPTPPECVRTHNDTESASSMKTAVKFRQRRICNMCRGVKPSLSLPSAADAQCGFKHSIKTVYGGP